MAPERRILARARVTPTNPNASKIASVVMTITISSTETPCCDVGWAWGVSFFLFIVIPKTKVRFLREDTSKSRIGKLDAIGTLSYNRLISLGLLTQKKEVSCRRFSI
jgi:hypothetical protein